MRMDFCSDTRDNLMLIYATLSLSSGENVFLLHRSRNKRDKIRKNTVKEILGKRKKIQFGTMANGDHKEKEISVIRSLKKDFVCNSLLLSGIKADTEQNQNTKPQT